jgi:deazaflavin-dependent oxidoreductase (nitroreductase family)
MWYNPIIRSLLRSPLHVFVSKNMMLMTYTGRKSGKSYTTPMSYLAVGDTLYTISSRERVWWRNLRGGRDINLRLQGEDVPAKAEVIEDQTEVADSLFLYLKAAPRLVRYLGVRIDADGNPSLEDIAKLAREKVMVRTQLK